MTPRLWGTVVALALAVALWLMHTADVRRARVDERMSVLREGDTLLSQATTHSRTVSRRIDSLLVESAKVDTVWMRQKAVAQTVLAAPIPTDSTALVAALTTCRVTLGATVSACDSVQAAQRAVIGAQQDRTRADSVALAQSAVIAAGLAAARDAALASVQRRTRWQRLERGVCGLAVLGAVIR